jgi:uncharacterized protein YciI
MSDAPERAAAPHPGVPSKAGEPPPQWAMRTYVLVLIYRGPTTFESDEENAAMQRAHLANNARLYEEGKLILAGPFRDKTDLRGIFLFDSESVEEVAGWCQEDAGIRSGWLRVEIHPWYSARGITIVPPAAP